MKTRLTSMFAVACMVLSSAAFAQGDLSSVGADIESEAHGALANRKAEAARDAQAKRELAEQQAAAAQAAQQAQADAMERQQIMGGLMNTLQSVVPLGSPMSQTLSAAAPMMGLPAPVSPPLPAVVPQVYSLGPVPTVSNQPQLGTPRIGVPAQKN